MDPGDSIVPCSIPARGGISSFHSSSNIQQPSFSAASVILIAKQRQLQEQDFLARASEPTVASTAKTSGDDLDCLQHYACKADIDAQRVSLALPDLLCLAFPAL
jgi:hypothetical protein